MDGLWAGFVRLFGRRVSAHAHLYVLSIEVCTKGRPISTKGKPKKWAETRPRISKVAQILGDFWAGFGRLFGRAGFRPSPSLIFFVFFWICFKNCFECGVGTHAYTNVYIFHNCFHSNAISTLADKLDKEYLRLNIYSYSQHGMHQYHKLNLLHLPL
jgi:hypothetical protein